MDKSIKQLVGKTLTNIELMRNEWDEYILFTTKTGEQYKMYHKQDCCEDVHIEGICGDLMDLLNSPIVLAEQVTDEVDDPEGQDEAIEHLTYTFYKIDTVKGGVTIRWYGGSSGYYSEEVDFILIDPKVVH